MATLLRDNRLLSPSLSIDGGHDNSLVFGNPLMQIVKKLLCVEVGQSLSLVLLT